ncbi:MAG: TonB-dependent receptor [Acidobacteriaceae bacterium]|nr:TonB-dependent receptor [Acidobacteriaceae bacterium]
MALNSSFASKQFGRVIAAAVLLAAAGQARGGDLSLPVTGNLLGSVADASGIPQMGATIQLFNKYARLVAKTNTGGDGRFAFVDLPADLYSIRVSLASFLPASREKIAIKAGLNSILEIHLATLFSSVELSYTIPAGAMTNDWKWVLRSSPATRPITRYLPVDLEIGSTAEARPRIFSGTHAMISVSGGDGGLIDSDSAQADFGTGFAVSTNVFGKNQIQVGGTLGQGMGIVPAAMGLAAIYSRSDMGALGEAPEVTLTVTQLGGLGMPLGGVSPMANTGLANGGTIRAMSLSVYEVADPLNSVHLEYGMTGESVDSMQHTARVSPFARMTVDFGPGGQVLAAYSDGGRPDQLAAHQQYQAAAETGTLDNDLTDTVSTLARLPQLSNRNGRLELERTQSYELGYRKMAGSRTYAVSAFYEDVSNGRLNVAGNLSALNPADLFSDGMSTTSSYNVGRYQREGYIASVSQKMTDSLDLALAYGRMGGFTPGATTPSNWTAPEKFLDEANHNIAAVNLQVRMPGSGTRLSASYGWVDSGAVIPRHAFTTQNTYITPGLNVDVRQPLPSFFGMPGHLELTANLRNLLTQGYLPFNTGDGHTLLIVQTPRSIRGGLNFVF